VGRGGTGEPIDGQSSEIRFELPERLNDKTEVPEMLQGNDDHKHYKYF
jgi:hypothetical protein